ncbi:hypothetical protein BD779DRAFT_289043 [Infundibulicybe gibba]|nr:hypothetical protein BD779DRAFT_289043 [Infundibulicybe gibba]
MLHSKDPRQGTRRSISKYITLPVKPTYPSARLFPTPSQNDHPSPPKETAISCEAPGRPGCHLLGSIYGIAMWPLLRNSHNNLQCPSYMTNDADSPTLRSQTRTRPKSARSAVYQHPSTTFVYDQQLRRWVPSRTNSETETAPGLDSSTAADKFPVRPDEDGLQTDPPVLHTPVPRL